MKSHLISLLICATCVICGQKIHAAPQPHPNILLICVDDLRPELNCFGKEYIQSPNIDALASRGRIFERHYVQAPTCGASRFTLLTGRYGGASNGALFGRAKAVAENPDAVPPSMPAWFRAQGYTTVSVGDVSQIASLAFGRLIQRLQLPPPTRFFQAFRA